MEKIQEELLEKAQALGIQYEVLTNYATDSILLTHGGQEVLFSNNGVPLHELSGQARFIANNKQYCKRLFKRLGISSPQSLIFQDFNQERDRLAAFMQEGRSYVCKPLDGMEGKGVHLHCKTLDDVAQALDENRQKGLEDTYTALLLEEQIQGEDLRLQAVGGQLVAACRREPATVVGDGQATVRQLMEDRAAIIHAQNPANGLVLDEQTRRLLREQGITLEEVPAAGQPVRLKYLANMNQGATAFDITDDIHPTYAMWIERLAKDLNQRVFALDVMTTDYTAPPTPENAWALEINGESYWLHHTFSEGRTHDIASLILKDTFDLA